MWKALVKAFPLIGSWLAWRIVDGKNVRVGEDPWVEAKRDFKLSRTLQDHLHSLNIHSVGDDSSLVQANPWRVA